MIKEVKVGEGRKQTRWKEMYGNMDKKAKSWDTYRKIHKERFQRIHDGWELYTDEDIERNPYMVKNRHNWTYYHRGQNPNIFIITWICNKCGNTVGFENDPYDHHEWGCPK